MELSTILKGAAVVACPVVAVPVLLGDYLSKKADATLGPKQAPAAPIAPKAPETPAPPPAPADPNAGKPQYTNGDARIDHTQNNKVVEHNSLQPLRQPGEAWDGSKILANQSQLSTEKGKDNKHMGDRCGAASVMAQAVMGGEDKTLHLVDQLASKSPAHAKELKVIHDKIKNGTATHEDLNHVEEWMYNTYHTGNQSGLSPDVVNKMQNQLLDTTTQKSAENQRTRNSDHGFSVTDGNGKTGETPSHTKDRVNGLNNGQSFVAAVDTNFDKVDTNHYVVVGKDASGRSYIYDPYPKANQGQIIYQDQNPDAFNYYTSGQMGVNTPNLRTGGTENINVVAGGIVG
jgi:hypothetical protein